MASSLSFSHFEAVWRTVGGRRTLVLGLDAFAFYRGPYARWNRWSTMRWPARFSRRGPARPGAALVDLWEEAFPLAAVRTLDPGASNADLRLTEEGRIRRTLQPWPAGSVEPSTRLATLTAGR